MAKIVTVEVVLKGDIIDKSILNKFAEKLRAQRYLSDFTSTIAVPPFLVATQKNYPSLAVLYATVELENLFHLNGLVEELAEEEKLEIISYKQL